MEECLRQRLFRFWNWWKNNNDDLQRFIWRSMENIFSRINHGLSGIIEGEAKFYWYLRLIQLFYRNGNTFIAIDWQIMPKFHGSVSAGYTSFEGGPPHWDRIKWLDIRFMEYLYPQYPKKIIKDKPIYMIKCISESIRYIGPVPKNSGAPIKYFQLYSIAW